MTGPFAFFDLRTRDLDASRAFCVGLAGWTVTEVTAGDAAVPLFYPPVQDAADISGRRQRP